MKNILGLSIALIVGFGLGIEVMSSIDAVKLNSLNQQLSNSQSQSADLLREIEYVKVQCQQLLQYTNQICEQGGK